MTVIYHSAIICSKSIIDLNYSRLYYLRLLLTWQSMLTIAVAVFTKTLLDSIMISPCVMTQQDYMLRNKKKEKNHAKKDNRLLRRQ